MEFERGQLVTHGSKWSFGIGQKNKYVVLVVIKCPLTETPSLKLFCFQGHHYGVTMYLNAKGMELWK